MVKHLVVQGGQELGEAHVLGGGDLLQRVPERHLQADRGAVAADAQRPRLGFVVTQGLMCEQLTHGFLSVAPMFLKFEDIPGPAAPSTCHAACRNGGAKPDPCRRAAGRRTNATPVEGVIAATVPVPKSIPLIGYQTTGMLRNFHPVRNAVLPSNDDSWPRESNQRHVRAFGLKGRLG
jgi:hypothetical protein